MSNILLNNVTEGNLKNISLEIPKNKLVVFTGLSGSGKSTLLVDVLFNECQRQYLETIGMQGINKPKVESAKQLSPAVLVSQTDGNKNPRSTVGTLTDIYTDLRMVYEKLGVRKCPHCGEMIANAECREETVKENNEFTVFMYCSECGHKMLKLSRTYLSFNTKEGACECCQGMGSVFTIDWERVIQKEQSLEEGAVTLWEHRYKDYQIDVIYAAFRHYGVEIPEGGAIKDYGPLQREILYHGVESEKLRAACPDIIPPKKVSEGRFEGVSNILLRMLSEKGKDHKSVRWYFHDAGCPECSGERLCKESREVTVQDIRLPQLSLLSLEQLYSWVQQLEKELGGDTFVLVEPYILDLKTKLTRLIRTGLGYLSLDRQAVTLSGGEMQRLRLAAILDSEMTGIIYVMDEPTLGLHACDTAGLIDVLKTLRDKGNSVYIIEHDPDIMREADYIIDIGPGAGKHGGQVVGQGSLSELMEQEDSVTGQYLKQRQRSGRVCRDGTGERIGIREASLHNLKRVDADIPVGCMTAVTGVSGSGKSTLIIDLLSRYEDNLKEAQITGMERFDQVVTIGQAAVSKTKRSNVATYTDIYTEIRKIFGNSQEAKEKGFTARHFSFNVSGGRCDNCEGMGCVDSNMLFFADTQITCPVCGGKQFKDEILEITYKGLNIKGVLELPVEDAVEVFAEHSKLKRGLGLLMDVGLGYLEIGQALTTLSGGECQRLKLARELIAGRGGRILYIMDEPTAGLHPFDIEHFLVLLGRLLDEGHTVVVVEHNLQIIQASDWVIDLGPEGGDKGGEVIFTGPPEEMMKSGATSTAEALRSAL